jgi:type I restriction enzyme S subunit
MPFIDWSRATSEGTKMPRTNWEKLSAFVVPNVGLREQRAIADFLDTETARIDALITKKRRMIALLNEHRRTYVAAAVTLGTDPNATRVATGSQFEPEVAEGWKLMRMRHVVREIVDTAHKTAPVVEGGGYLVVRTANVKAGRLLLEDAQYTDRQSWVEWTARGVPVTGDVIFTREAPAGEACLVPEEPPLCIGQRTVLLRPSSELMRGAWLLHSIYSGTAQRFIEVLSRSTTVPHINMSDIPDIPIVVPPIHVQDHVLRQIESVAHRCERLSTALVKQIELLGEHGKALITAAVTGELDVPGAAA